MIERYPTDLCATVDWRDWKLVLPRTPWVRAGFWPLRKRRTVSGGAGAGPKTPSSWAARGLFSLSFTWRSDDEPRFTATAGGVKRLPKPLCDGTPWPSTTRRAATSAADEVSMTVGETSSTPDNRRRAPTGCLVAASTFGRAGDLRAAGWTVATDFFASTLGLSTGFFASTAGLNNGLLASTCGMTTRAAGALRDRALFTTVSFSTFAAIVSTTGFTAAFFTTFFAAATFFVTVGFFPVAG